MARTDDESSRDAAGVGPYARGGGDLTPLRELDDWAITDGSADIRGWRVVTLGGRELGRVEDLLVDTEEREVVMFTIDLADSPRTARAPLRVAQVERDQRLVRIDSADIEGAGAVEAEEMDRQAAERDAADGDEAARERKIAERERLERERIERRATAAAAADRIAVQRRDRVVERDTARDADRVQRDRAAEERVADERAAGNAPVERVVETRPVVVEEVVVRRRTVAPDSPDVADTPRDATSPDAELHRDKPGETF